MKLARVVGNVVSTIKDECFAGQKLMIVDYIDEDGNLTGNHAICFDVADAGMLMPPKSTWFEPKLRSGLFIHGLKILLRRLQFKCLLIW